MQHRLRQSERTCIVTRAAAPVDTLIRFVVAPDGAVVPDFRRRLPGRGIWVTARADHVETAERRRLFARVHGSPVNIEPGLADRVEKGLASAALAALSLARKGGTVVSGFAKVESALVHGEVIGIIHAPDAGTDGIAKLTAASRRRERSGELAIIRCFTRTELDLAFGRTNVVHAALLAGPASKNLLARIGAWRDYCRDERKMGTLDRRSSEMELSKELASSGQRIE